MKKGFNNLLVISVVISFLSINSCNNKDVVPVLETTPASNITSNSASSGGSIKKDGGSQIWEKGICWSTSPNPTTNDQITNDGTGVEEYTSALTNLTPNTTYYLRAYASNTTGTGYGDELTFTTPEGTVETGDLEIFVRENTASGPYVGEARVRIYLSLEDRNNDNFIETQYTPKDDPSVNGAVFKDLTYKKYYIRADYTNGQGIWMGVAETFITLGQTKKVTIITVL